MYIFFTDYIIFFPFIKIQFIKSIIGREGKQKFKKDKNILIIIKL